MNESANQEEPFSEDVVPQGPAMTAALIVDVDGYEGPLDVLLMLARAQKVDLKKISIVALVDQYLSFIAAAKRLQLELAADYLVMAAWLAYLKSRLVIPDLEKKEEEISGEEMAARLAFQLQRLQAMRDTGARLMARHRLGRDVFSRGMPEGIRLVRTPVYRASIYDLLKAYSEQRIRGISHDKLKIRRAPVFAIEDARKRIERLFGTIQDWSQLDSLLPEGWIAQSNEAASPEQRRRTARASTFTASLELVKDGHVEIRQLEPFGPVYIRWRNGDHDGEREQGSGTT